MIKDANSDSVKSAQTRKTSPDKTAPDESNQVIDLDLDHTYASPTPQLQNDVNDNSVENDQNQDLKQQHDNHTYALIHMNVAVTAKMMS